MTVLTATCSQRFHGSGGVGPFTWPWRFLANADIRVYRIDAPDEEDPAREEKTLLTAGDYILTGAGSYQGGSLTLGVALGNGKDLLVERATSALQSVSIRNQGNNFRPEVHEDVFDRLTMMIQDMVRDVTRAEDIVSILGDRVTVAESGIGDLQMRVTTLEHTQHVVVLPAAGVAGDIFVYADASAGPVVVDIVAASDVLARPVVIVKTDETDNPVVITPAAGTISSSEGRTATCELTIRDESIRVVPNAALNNWFKG